MNLALIIQFTYGIFLGVHYFVCLWIWIGDRNLMNDPSLPWRQKQPDLQGERLYIFVIYWVFEVITTVGYGDFAGGTTAEFLVSLLIEFSGLIVFTVLTLLVDQLV
jgi:Ion channel